MERAALLDVGTSSRVDYHCVTDTQTHLLDALDRVIATHGPSGVTLRKVGIEAGLSHTAAAHYYGDKAGLFTAYITRGYNQLGERIEAVADGADPKAAMLDAAGVYAHFALDCPSVFSVLQRLELTRVDTPDLWTARERCYFGVSGILARNQASGWASDRDLRDLLATTWAFVHGFVDLWVGGPLAAPYDGDDLAPTLRRIFDALLTSIDA